MTPFTLIKQVQQAGGSIFIAGNKLRLSAPRPLPSALIETLKVHRGELLECLRNQKGGVPAHPTLGAYEYRLVDNPGWLILLAPGGLTGAKQTLINRFGSDRVLEVRVRVHAKRPASLLSGLGQENASAR